MPPTEPSSARYSARRSGPAPSAQPLRPAPPVLNPDDVDATSTLFQRDAAELIVIVNGRAPRAAVPVVPVVPQSLLCPPVTPDPGPALSSYDVNAAFMSFQPHESGIHAV